MPAAAAVFNLVGALDFVIVLGVILLSTKLFGLLFRHFGLPQVLGYIVAGLLIGPAIFGDLLGFSLIGFVDYDPVTNVYYCEAGHNYKMLFGIYDEYGLEIFSKIGVLFLMFSAGLETNLDDLKKTGLASCLIAIAGVVIPMVLGILISLPFGNIGLGTANFYRCIFIGAILTATSVAITVSVLKELGKINTKLGTTIVSAAIIDDVIGIVVLSVVTGMAKGGDAAGLEGFAWFKAQWWGTVIMIVAYFVVAIGAGFGVSKLFKWLDKKWPGTHRLPVFSIAVVFIYSWVAEEIFGVADITGAFLAGVVLSTCHRAGEYIDKKIDVNTYTLFAPVFFANIGISSITFLGLNPAILLFSILCVLLGLIGKVIGGMVVAKSFKYSWTESTIAGVGIMARGEVALIVTATVTDKALGVNALPDTFVIMTVLLILLSSILTPILLKVLYKRVPDELPLAK